MRARAQVLCDRSGLHVVRGPVSDSQDCLEWEKAPTLHMACLCVVHMHEATLFEVKLI